MKMMFLAAAAAVVVLSTPTYAMAPTPHASQENLTGVPSYMMRSDGLLLNGIPPNRGSYG
jgi:hypothetical protein